MTIPANYVRLDSTVKAADRFLDTNTATVLMENHDKLLAERAKHCILSLIWPHLLDPDSAGGTDINDLEGGIRSLAPASVESGVTVISIPIRISDQTRELQINMWASIPVDYELEETSHPAVKVFPVVHAIGGRREIDKNIFITAGSPFVERLSVVVPVPRFSPQQRENMVLTLFMDGGVGVGEFASGVAIVDASPGSITSVPAALVNAGVTSAMVIHTDNAATQPELANAVIATAAQETLYIDKWGEKPDPVGDLAASRYPATLVISTLIVYELSVTDFSAPSAYAGVL
jgi:hypothetical protein